MMTFILFYFLLFQNFFGNFEKAKAISIDINGNIYVVDEGNCFVQKFSLQGDSLVSLGNCGWSDYQFQNPKDIFAKNGLDIFVADFENHRVQRFNRKMNFIASFYTRDDEDLDNRFGFAQSVAVNSKNEIFIADGENKRVLKFSNFSSNVEKIIGGINAGKGKLKNPIQIEFDSLNQLYVLEKNKIICFDEFGNYFFTIGNELLKNATGFSIHRNKIFVAEDSTLKIFSLDGKFLEEKKIDFQIEDVALYENHIFLLTEKKVFLYKEK